MNESDPKLLDLQSALVEVQRLREENVRLQDGQIVAICRRGKTRQKIPILDLPLPAPAPAGVEWIVAFRHWRRGSW